jgi:hypothetical protein
MPAIGDNGWSTPVNANSTSIDGFNACGDLCVTTNEVPSATLTVAVAGGTYVRQDGTVGTYAGGTTTLSASVTRVLYFDATSSYALTVAASYPTTGHVRLATVVTGSSTISSITDNRQAFDVCGSWVDGINVSLGSTTGTQIGTASTQKLGFFGVTPVVQPGSTTDLRTAIINVGLLATGGATPLNLNGGALTVGGATVADGGNIALGTSTGTQIGTSSTQKIGFFGKTPAVQVTLGAATAGSSYTTNEQTMLQNVYNLARTLGLGS